MRDKFRDFEVLSVKEVLVQFVDLTLQVASPFGFTISSAPSKLTNLSRSCTRDVQLIQIVYNHLVRAQAPKLDLGYYENKLSDLSILKSIHWHPCESRLGDIWQVSTCSFTECYKSVPDTSWQFFTFREKRIQSDLHPHRASWKERRKKERY